MPITVTCPGCKATFNVSEKFAGKQGPCPKCKAPITIPKPPAPAAGAAAGPPPEIKIHGPEVTAKDPKTKTGAPNLKPIFRQDARLTWKLATVVIVTIVVLFVAAALGGKYVQSPPPLTDADLRNDELVSVHRMALIKAYVLRALALCLVGWPVMLAGYAVLRDDELEPFRGSGLRRRMMICMVGYLAAWGLYAVIPDDLLRETYLWVLLAPVVILPAAAAAYFTFDLDYLGSVIHACFFLLVTLLLGWTAGLSMPWQPPPANSAPISSDVPLEVIYK